MEFADTCSDWLFLIVAALSISALAVERTKTPDFYDLVQGAFVIGVLALFLDNPSAINAVVEVQRKHQQRMGQIPADNRMPIRIGVASGDVEIVAGDCYGDAVNVAARLSDLAGVDVSRHQVWRWSKRDEDPLPLRRIGRLRRRRVVALPDHVEAWAQREFGGL